MTLIVWGRERKNRKAGFEGCRTYDDYVDALFMGIYAAYVGVIARQICSHC